MLLVIAFLPGARSFNFMAQLPSIVILELKKYKICHYLQQRKGLFTRQPSEETGEEISDLPPWRWRAGDIYGIKKQGFSIGKGGWRWGKGEVIRVLCRYIWVTRLLSRMYAQQWRCLAWSEGGVFGSVVQRSLTRLLCRPSFRVSGLTQS